MSSWFSDFYSWIDDRLGLSQLRSAFFNSAAAHNPSRAFPFFSAFVAVLIIESITGFCLALYYVPSADHAHTTVEWIQKEVAGGAFIRSLHHWSTDVLLVLLGLHLMQVLFGRRNRDELTWIFGGSLFLLTLGFAMTGGLLPWDQNAYFSTRRLLGAARLGTITLSRFYAAHAMMLPLLAVLLIVLHFISARNFRVEATFSSGSIVSFVAVTVVTILAVTRPAVLEPNANPADLQYLSHPDWYLLPILQFLKIFGGTPGTVLFLLLTMMAGLILMPFLPRRVATSGFLMTLLVSGGFFFFAKRGELSGGSRGRLGEEAFLAAQEAAKPFEPEQIGSATSVGRDRLPPVPRQFAACAECHGDLGGGGMIGPDLINVAKKYGTPERLEAVLLDPQAYGVAAEQMPKFTDDRMPAYERKALIQYLSSLPRN